MDTINIQRNLTITRTRCLFIDIDGVLHPSRAIEGLPPTVTPTAVAAQLGLMQWVPILADLLAAHPDPYLFIMVHSSWRLSIPEREIRDLLAPLMDRYAGLTYPDVKSRYNSIEKVVCRSGINDYLVLDDAEQEFPANWPQLCLCDPELGISERAVQDRIKAWLAS
jgi:hypothetical protein